MRFRLTLRQKYDNQSISYGYQYPISSFIYYTLSKANPEYSKWLHDEGISKGYKHFKFFTFSQLNIPERETHRGYMVIKSHKIFLDISILLHKISESFIAGLFKDQDMYIQHGTRQSHFKITHIETIPDPEFTGRMQFKTISPVVLKKRVIYEGKESEQYLPPDSEDYFNLLKTNIEEKYIAWCNFSKQQAIEYKLNEFRLLDTPKAILTEINKADTDAIKIKSYRYRFELAGDKEFIKFGYNTGFGINNSLGFGMVTEISTNKSK